MPKLPWRPQPDTGRQQRPEGYNLVRWFTMLSLACVMVSGVGTALLLSRFLTENMLERDAEVSQEFLDGIVRAEQTWTYFVDPAQESSRVPLESFFNHIARLPGVVRANVFDANGAILWSTDATLIGRRFDDNKELGRALRGRVVVESGTTEGMTKAEHVALETHAAGGRFLDVYLPVWDQDRQRVIGAVEIYRLPDALFRAIDPGVRLIRTASVLSSLLLYGALTWIVARARQTVLRQQAKLREAELNIEHGAPPSVLVRGETGTGKQLVARTVHFEGPRRDGLFVEINCSSLPAQLLEGELFGHERGAFTDARERRQGLVEAAQGGTLCLDEIGDLEAGAQVKLLKLLEDRTLRRLGSVKEQQVDVRFITATHQPLEQLVREGRFRADLYYRLSVVTLHVPTLRERDADVLLLAESFLAAAGRRYGRAGLHLTGEAKAALMRHAWPGNVRELRNTMEQAVLAAEQDNRVGLAQLDGLAQGAAQAEVSMPGEASTLPALERRSIQQALSQAGGNVTRAARNLGISRDTLRYRMAKHGLESHMPAGPHGLTGIASLVSGK